MARRWFNKRRTLPRRAARYRSSISKTVTLTASKSFRGADMLLKAPTFGRKTAPSHVVPCPESGDSPADATDAKPAGENATTVTTTATDAAAPTHGTKTTSSRSSRKITITMPRSTTWSQSAGSLLHAAAGDPTTINVLRTSLNELNDHVRYHWVLHPQSPLKALWDLTSALVVIYYSWIIPFMLSFEWYTPSDDVNLFMKVLDIWGFLDIALRFRTGIIQYGVVKMNPKVISRAYVRSVWFPIDLASSIPFEYFIHDNVTNVSTRKTFKIIKYIKLPRLLRIGRFLKNVKRYKRYSSLTIALNTLLFAAHVAGCIWVSILDPCQSPPPVDITRCASGNELQTYWIAFQHGMVSLLGISATHVEATDSYLSGGYHFPQDGDSSSAIYLWSTGVSILGTIITAVLFGTIGNLTQSWNRAENAFRKKMDHVTHEMDALCLPKPLRARVTAYYDYLWLNNRTFSEQLNLLKDEGMSLALREQVAIYLFKDYLLKIPFFQLATDSVLGMICMQLRQVIYMPDDFIIREGDIGKELFMVVKGIVRVLPRKAAAKPETEEVILLSEGDFFGEIGVVMEVERTRSVKAECMAELCTLSREGFDKILVEFPEFATAMKRLIVKRVGEMWKNDGPERMEKMTALADAKMKKSVQAYKNLEKLRSKTRVLQTLHPRLSKIVSSDTLPSKKDLELDAQGSSNNSGNSGASLTLGAGVDATPAVGEAAPLSARPLAQEAPLMPIKEAEGEITMAEPAATDRCSSMPAVRDKPANALPPAAAEAPETTSRSMEYSDKKPLRSTPSSSSGSLESIPPLPRTQQLELQLRLVEQKMEARLAALDDKLDRLLRCLAATPNSAAASTQ